MKVLAAVLLFVASVNGFGRLCKEEKKTSPLRFPPATTMPENLKVAFIGDAGAGIAQRNVLQMIKDWDAAFVIHSGDFEYENDPDLFEDNLNAVLGPDYPYWGSVGNHDNLAWGGRNGHQEKLIARMERANASANCEGEYGVNMACDYKGLYFVLSGVGTRGQDHETYIDQAFSARPAIWKVTSWHKNQRLMQIGGKFNEVGWDAYDTARKHGAIIATGHEHSYCRSYMMSNIEDQDVSNFNETLNMRVGESFVFVSGLAGKDIRDWDEDLKDNEWWAAVGASDNDVQYGALLCTFNVDGNARQAHCVQRDIDGKDWDDFTIVSHLASTQEEMDRQLAAFNKKEAKSQACKSRFIEIPTSPEFGDLIEETETGKIACAGDILSFKKRSHAVLRFQNIPLKKGEKVKHAHLQVYGAESSEKLPSFAITGSMGDWGFKSVKCNEEKSQLYQMKQSRPMINKAKAEVTWEVEDEDWEIQNVWLSPDLHEIVNELVTKKQWREGSDIVLDMIGSGDQSFYSHDYSPCFAPTLSLEIERAC